MTDKHITITRGKTHTDTARAIHAYLRDNRDQLPNDDANRAGTGHCALVFVLNDSNSAVKVTELTGSSFAATPAVVRDKWTSTGDYIGYSAVLHRQALYNDDPSEEIHRIRLVVMRIDRYQSKQARKQAAHDAIYA